ncbi:MAG: hypothetical protein OSJ59_18730 [Lachnospiraceae bacterium]|nr:hypothetical protein [Lachnospiraceae bacterium]
MARRARLTFMPIDYAYQARYGKMPDYDFTDRLKAGQNEEEVSALIDSRMRKLWEESKQEHEKKEQEKVAALEAECPF